MLERLRDLERLLSPLVASFGFVLSDIGEAGAGSLAGESLGQLEYRTAASGPNSLRLDICWLGAARSMTAEVWAPADLATLPADIGVDTAAIHRRVWGYGETQDLDLFVHEIVEQIGVWLMQPATASRSVLGVPSAQIARPGS